MITWLHMIKLVIIILCSKTILGRRYKPNTSEQCWDETTEYKGAINFAGAYICNRVSLCRNPANLSKGPYCYITKGYGSTIYKKKSCNIPRCSEACNNYNKDPLGKEYVGKIFVTSMNEECQRWDTDTPNEVANNETPIDGKHHNYCRNPDGDSGGPWCYIKNVQKDSEINWRSCSIPKCKEPTVNDCKDGLGLEYSGKIDRSKSGRRCQFWNSKKPHIIPRSMLKKIPKGTKHNYCRNYDKHKGGPWCYTRDPKKRWEHCSQIPSCKEEHKEPKCGISCYNQNMPCFTGNLKQSHNLKSVSFSTKISNGFKSSKGQWPWQVGLRSLEGSNFCGGSIINKRFILTAAHCVVSNNGSTIMQPNKLAVAIGFQSRRGNKQSIKKDDKSFGQQFIVVKRIILHYRYDSRKVVNDIALLELKADIYFPKEQSNFKLTKTLVRPVCLPSRKYDRTMLKKKSECVVSGFGITETGAHKKGLQHGFTSLLVHNDCEERLDHGIQLTKKQLCAYEINVDKKSIDTCKGDSGGPLSCMNLEKQYVQVGVTSFGFEVACGYGIPGIYTRVSKYITWIKKYAGRIQVI